MGHLKQRVSQFAHGLLKACFSSCYFLVFNEHVFHEFLSARCIFVHPVLCHVYCINECLVYVIKCCAVTHSQLDVEMCAG